MGTGRPYPGTVRHTEFWARMDKALGSSYSRTWAEQFVMAGLGNRTVTEALQAGETPKHVWHVVWEVLELPASQR